MKKFIKTKKINNYEVLTDTGWVDIYAIHKTIKYNVYELITENNRILCADNHIIFNESFTEIFVKDLKINDLIQVKDNLEKVISVKDLGYKENMYDLELDDDSNHRYYTNNVLSHNTTYLKKLIIDVDKKFIYINPSIVGSLLSPEFVDFMVANSDSVLIIEEAEKIIKDRNNLDASQSAISNLLNISDGLMSDALSMKIICTFNADIKDIDKALMRKGRIMSKYEFKALEKDKAQAMINEIHPDDNIIIDKKMTLAEIYNFNKQDYQVKQNSIGFGSR